MSKVESSPERWDFEAGYIHEPFLESGAGPNLQEPDDPTDALATDLFTPPVWPHSY